MNNARFSALADRLANLIPADSEAIQLIRSEIVELKLLLERLCQRELADFLGAADSMVRSIGVLDGDAFEQVRELVCTLLTVVSEAVDGMGSAAAQQPQAALPVEVEQALEKAEAPAQERTTLHLEGETPSSSHSGIRTMSELLLGQILIDNQELSRPQLVAALKLQTQEHLRIGEALVHLGFVTNEQVEEGLNKQQDLVNGLDASPKMKRSSLLHDLTLGEILTRVGGVSQEDLERALQVQRASGKRLGEALVELGIVTWNRVEEATRIQSRSRSQSAWGTAPGGGPSLRLDD